MIPASRTICSPIAAEGIPRRTRHFRDADGQHRRRARRRSAGEI